MECPIVDEKLKSKVVIKRGNDKSFYHNCDIMSQLFLIA